MRILLVKPNARLGLVRGLHGFTFLEPLELGYLAASVPSHHEVRVLDLRLARAPERALRSAVSSWRPELVGLTGYSHEGSTVKRLARLVRTDLPTARVVVGGHHATVAPDDYDVEGIDAVVRGEGCAPFAAIVAACEEGGELEGIPGVLVPGSSLRPATELEWPRFPDPATMPRPRRDLWDWRRYYSVWTSEKRATWERIFRPVSMVRTSWGCRMQCSFCVVPFLCGGQHRPRPVEDVVDEIAGLPTDHVYFSDDENFIDRTFAGALAEALSSRGVRKRYYAWARSTTVNRDPELMARWREVGLDTVFIGFEHATDAELRQARKGGTVAANERALDTLRSLGVVVHAAFMLMPEYTEEQFAGLARYVDSLPPAECSFTVCTPSPGTPDYEALRPRMWVDNPFDLHDCMHPVTPTAVPLRRFAELYSRQAAAGTARTPMRQERHLPHLWDLARVQLADLRYIRAFRNLYRDYPRHLWGSAEEGLAR